MKLKAWKWSLMDTLKTIIKTDDKIHHQNRFHVSSPSIRESKEKITAVCLLKRKIPNLYSVQTSHLVKTQLDQSTMVWEPLE